MAYTTVNKHTDYFNTVLYTGNTTAPRTITGVGFQPDWNWTKNRSATLDHWIADSVKGINSIIRTSSATTNLTNPSSGYISATNSDGYVISEGSSSDDNYNTNSQNYVSWNWKAGSSNTSVSASGSGNGAINACTYRANTTAGFSIVKYTGRNSDISNGQETKVAHGLGVKPDFVLIKRLDGSNINWVARAAFSPLKSDYHVMINNNDARTGSFYVGNGDNDDATHFVVGNSGRTNENGNEFIAYVFVNKTGYSRFGTYRGNGNADGTFVYTGFKPSFLIMKRTDATGNWLLYDNKRDIDNPTTQFLAPNSNQAESTLGTTNPITDFLSNGFKLRGSGGDGNASDGTIFYMAFGQSLVGSNNVPCTAR